MGFIVSMLKKINEANAGVTIYNMSDIGREMFKLINIDSSKVVVL